MGDRTNDSTCIGGFVVAVTLRDVAAKAGVSPIVVSRVLHNKALSIRVTEATAERVRMAAKELGYRKNEAAVNFRTGQTFTIGLLHRVGTTMPRLDGTTRYFPAMLDGIVQGAFDNGYSVTLCPRLFASSSEVGTSDGRFDGLIVYDMEMSDAGFNALQASTFPVVLLHRMGRDFDYKSPSVICDNQEGINLAMGHLLDLGHRKIAFAQAPGVAAYEQIVRKRAFAEFVHSHGLCPNQCRFVAHGEFDEILSGDFTAVIAYHDAIAAEIMRSAQSRGLSVPGDLSIIGFDSTNFCLELRPSLTSVHQPLGQMGRAAADLLIKAIRDELSSPSEMIFPCRLDVRESTGPPNVWVTQRIQL